MKENRNKLCFALMVATMVTIFIFSAQDGNESGEVSNRFLLWILSVVGNLLPAAIISFLKTWIRKVAHFTIYCVLGFFAKGTFPKWKWYRVWLISIIYACTDEFHQNFVPGRACQARDVCIDAVGALAGIGLMLLICLPVKRRNTEVSEPADELD